VDVEKDATTGEGQGMFNAANERVGSRRAPIDPAF